MERFFLSLKMGGYGAKTTPTRKKPAGMGGLPADVLQTDSVELVFEGHQGLPAPASQRSSSKAR